MAHSITLQNISDTVIIDNDILGQICFAAPNESSGTDSILISASVFARSEGTFAADNNATELVFVTGASESAAPAATNGDMTLSSAGLLTVADDIVIKSAGTIGGANDVDLLTLGNGVLTVAGEIEGTSLDISGDGDIDGALEVGSIELGHASDTTIARASAGQITVEGTAVVLAGAVTGITSLLATDIKIGEDDETKIDFETANQINFYADNTKRVTIDSTGLTVDSGSIETATIDYTDGDNAMTIADGGKVTFAAGFDVGSDAAGDILYHNGTSYVRLGIGSDGQVLTVNDAANAPGWENASGGGASAINDLSDALVENDSIYLGNDPSGSTSGANRNIAVGTTALDSVTNADDNIAIGYNAGTAITSTSDKNILIGSYAGENLNSNSDGNVFIGYEAGHGLVDYHSNSVLVGHHAGYSSSNDRDTWTNNVSIGYFAGREGNCQYSTHIGNLAGEYNAGSRSVAIGYSALAGSSSTTVNTYYSIGIGYQAGDESTGNRCIYIGYDTGSDNTVDNMLFIGRDSPTSDGTIIKADMNNKHVAIGMADDHFSGSAGDPTLQIYPKDAADEALYIKLTASHSGDALLVEDNSGNDKYRVTHGGAVKTGIKTNTDGSTVTFDLDEGNTHQVTLGGNRTLAISNEDEGQRFLIKLIQDGTGSRTVTWFSTIKWAGGTVPTLTTTAGKADLLGFLCTGTDTYDGFIVGQNI
tara:strand:+ start:17692 stop:19809 length:2118 start_codon:yes stop_codon:yes gene_type:complete